MSAQTEAEPADTSDPRVGLPRRPRLLSDQLRFWLSLPISIAVTFVLQFATGLLLGLTGAVRRVDLHSLAFVFTNSLGGWFVFCACFCLLTYAGFRRRPATALHTWLSESAPSERRRRLRERLLLSGGPVAAVALAVFAFTAVIVVALNDDLRGSPSVIVTAMLAVLSSWIYIVVVYSTHYARAYANHSGLRFPQPDESTEPYPGPSMSDFLYLSAQVATTFSSSDVEITSSRMRRVVTAHTLVMFTFNTVIVALLVSVLVSVAG